MINDIINGITTAIYQEFGEGYKIYTENIEQGLKEPCFFIAVLEAEQSRIIGNRYMLSANLDVHYFPGSKAKNREMQDVAQRLHSTLQRITLLDGDMLNGFGLRWESVDDVLHFFVSYKVTVRYPQAVIDQDMNTMTVTTTTESGD